MITDDWNDARDEILKYISYVNNCAITGDLRFEIKKT